MTYCAAISIDAGIVFVSDSRTNAGVDNVSTYSKMYNFGVDVVNASLSFFVRQPCHDARHHFPGQTRHQAIHAGQFDDRKPHGRNRVELWQSNNLANIAG